MKSVSKSPVFIVGCPRSGTTLLQSFLAAHSAIASFPESKFFQYLRPNNHRVLRRMGLVSDDLKPRMNVFLTEVGRPELLKDFPNSPFAYSYPPHFVEMLNSLTCEQGKELWLEKTPEHIYCISDIEKFIPEAKFIHICRRGADVVASLYEVTQRYPRAWGGKAWTIDQCIDRWNRATQITFEHQHRKNHFVVTYGELVSNSEYLLRQVCDFLGLVFEPDMVSRYAESAQQWAHPTAGRTVTSAIQSKGSEKFDRLFTDIQRQEIIKRTYSEQLEQLSQAA